MIFFSVTTGKLETYKQSKQTKNQRNKKIKL